MAKQEKLRCKELRRNQQMDSMQRVCGFIKGYTEDQQHQVSTRLEHLEKIWESFERVQDDIDDLDTSEEGSVTNQRIRSETEELYLYAKAQLRTMRPVEPNPVAEKSIAESASSSRSKVKLPTITLPEFGGNFDEWLTFHDTFVSLIHSSTEMSAVAKFHYLRASLKEEAAHLIQAISVTSGNYELAWNTIVKRYSNKIILRKKHIRSLISLPKMKDTGAVALNRLIDDFRRHVSVLEQLEQPVKSFSSIFIELMADKLDEESLRVWEESQADKDPVFTDMMEFMEKRVRVLETLSIDKFGSTHKKPAKAKVSLHAATTNNSNVPVCLMCNKNGHSVASCMAFKSTNIEERLKVVNEKRLCRNCLKVGHMAHTCSSKYSCLQCSERHHTLLHTKCKSDDVVVSSPAASVSTMALASSEKSSVNALLSTVVLVVLDAYRKEHVARALLDNGSQPNAMSEHLCQLLRLQRKPARVSISGVDSTTTSAKHVISTEVRSRIHNYSQNMDFLVLRKVTANIPSASFSTTSVGVPSSYVLADPDFGTARRVDMIIGAAYFYSLLRGGQVYLPNQRNILIDTVFGWIVTGDTPTVSEWQGKTTLSCHMMEVTDDVQTQLERFWNVEELSVSSMSPDEQQCEQYFKETTSRDEAGRYIVRMPKQQGATKMLGDSRAAAQKRFRLLEQRLSKDKQLKQHYDDFMQEYLSLGHMFAVPKEADSMHYLPHHPVVKEASTTTKVRVVFDGSAKTTTGHSLNDVLLVGPVVQDELLSLIVRFRKYKVAVIADIEKMYRQVSMHPDDRQLQCIFWRFKETDPVQTFELATVTYGLAPSSFLATRTLLQLAEDEGVSYPLATEAVKKNLYVDDLISGAESIEQAVQLRDELIYLMSKGGFRFRKWCSNELGVLDGLAPDLLGIKSSHEFEAGTSIKTLGICWEPPCDLFRFTVTVPDIRQCTKRSVLSTIAQLYNPLGLISPIVVQAKILLQELWAKNLTWDEELPRQLSSKWNEFCTELPRLAQFTIPRFAFAENYQHAELHCFADASEYAYGTCIYVRSETDDGSICVNLLASKSRVAPLKPLTIPRLELCAALLAARLYEKVVSALNIRLDACYFWSDSTVTLQWLKAPPRTWKTFVANRVAEIQSLSKGCIWQHVLGKENPADMVSRGVSASTLVSSKLWKFGPPWLQETKSSWPSANDIENIQSTAETERKEAVVLTLVKTRTHHELFERYSSYQRLLRVIAYCFRFVQNARNRNQRNISEYVSVTELQHAKRALVKLLQSEEFPDEIKQLQKDNRVSNKSSLRLLIPFLDSDGIVRVGGRLNLSKASFDVKHPILIPSNHPFTQLLLKYEHERLVHGGISMTLAAVREEFWPLSGRRAIRNIIRKCYRCNRANPHPIEQPIGQLPVSRVTSSGVFVCTGIDYCGPIMLKPIHRKAPARKVYICIFVCLSTKAVHLELASDLSTGAFLMALDRFIYRRNKPQHIYSDNGTNFIGAKNALHQVYRMLNYAPDSNQIGSHLAKDGIQWHLIPPRAPNFGGLWEAAVKVAKTQLVRQLGSSMLAYEELGTVLAKIEGCMNSRPLLPMSDDPNDFNPLTPAHFLIKGMLRPPPEADIRNLPLNRLDQYQRIQRLLQDFWHRWNNEYLKQLNQQYRMNPKVNQLAIGDLVIMKDELLPPSRWPLARIIELHTGPDDINRVATLRTLTGTVKRAVSKICLLECARENSN